MIKDLSFARIIRILRKPPKVILSRLLQEGEKKIARYKIYHRSQACNLKKLLHKLESTSLPELWQRLSHSAFMADSCSRDIKILDENLPNHRTWILERAANALQHKINLLGSGLIYLGETIDWHKDYKTGIRWENRYCHDISYMNLDKPSDVKIPWEISRLQWLIPAGQAYLLTGDDQYADAVKHILLDWIKNNPYASSVNWSCTMEVALRIIVWVWFFRIFKNAPSWQDQNFQALFLNALYLHARFTSKHLEISDINGNHYTANAAGLVIAGLFFYPAKKARDWLRRGWQILIKEIKIQVADDGVDYEASIPYHRFVCELFFLPAFYRTQVKLAVPDYYISQLIKMAEFINAYSRTDGSTPLLGDADDARVLPFGDQSINDHRYLISLIAHTWNVKSLLPFSAVNAESYWLLGEQVFNYSSLSLSKKKSIGFENSGYYIMTNSRDHIFIDCAAIGLAGRGGHGHNDCLSFEAMLDGELLVTDSGAYLYTASYQERNYFRSNAAHNTPQIDRQEMNRFESPYHLWTLHNDAKPTLIAWQPSTAMDYFCGSHSGYTRVKDPVIVKRSIYLLHEYHILIIKDEFESRGEHSVIIPLHLAADVKIEKIADNFLIEKNSKKFHVFRENNWPAHVVPDRISPSYGVTINSQTIKWQTTGLLTPFTMIIAPALISIDETKLIIKKFFLDKIE